MSWHDGVVYQIYPRSFQDSDGDGVGDLRGIIDRIEHLEYLGVDAFWLSPVYPSPLADFGYDVSGYTDIDPTFGSLDDFDALVTAAHERGLKVLMDLVPCHTSIEHPWFREHPDWYIWAESEAGPPNNWLSAFGGPAWSRDERSGRWYMHSFYPEQPDLDWHNPEVVRAMQEVVHSWIGRGVDGFRLDVVERLMKDPELRDDPPASDLFPLLLLPDEARREFLYSRNRPETVEALRALREAAEDAFLVGEVYLPMSQSARYLAYLDRVFVFELLQAPWEAERLEAAIETGARLAQAPSARQGAGPAWVLSNHDFGRLAGRAGRENERVAALLLLTLPGGAFIYQGDEIGLGNGPGADPPYDRLGRDGFRHPMQWNSHPHGGFTGGKPWLPPVDPLERNVADQREDPTSVLRLYRELIVLRRELGEGFRMLETEPGVLAYQRGRHIVAINLTAQERPCPDGTLVIATHADAQPSAGRLAPHAGAMLHQR